MSEVNIGPFKVDIPWPPGPTFHPVKEAEFQKGLANIELGMNWAGYIVPFLPFVNNWAGQLRIAGGFFETVLAIAISGIRLGQSYMEKDAIEQEKKMNRVWESLEYAKHGVANMARGCVEQIRVINLVAGYLWDYSGKRMQYQAEIDLKAAQARKA